MLSPKGEWTKGAWLSLKMLLLSLSLSLRFNDHFPGEPESASVYWSKGWWRWWWQLGYWSYKSCKAPVKSSPTSSFLQALPVTQPTVSKHWRENITFHGFAYPSSPGVFQRCLWPLIAPGYLGEGCHASHQPSDASTLTTTTTNFCKSGSPKEVERTVAMVKLSALWFAVKLKFGHL